MKRIISLFLSLCLVIILFFGNNNASAVIKKPAVKKPVKKVAAKQTKPVVKKAAPSKSVTPDKALESGVNWIKNQVIKGDYKISDWYAITLGLAGMNVDSDSFKKDNKGYIDSKKEAVKDEIGNDKPVTNYARYIMGLASAGYDPSYFEGHDLIQELSARIEKGDDTITGQMWGMIALASVGADFNHESAAKYLESKQNKDGGYGWMANVPSDPDTTAMAVYALTMSGRDKNASSVKNALTFIKSSLKSMEKDKSKETVETLDQVLMAVVSAKDNLSLYKINGKNISDEITGFVNTDGGFKHDKTGASNAFSTYQTVTALEFFKNNKNVYLGIKDKIKNALEPVTASIRVEGFDKTLLRTKVTLNNRIVFDSNNVSFDTKKISAYAFLMRALKNTGISSVADYGFGMPYVSTIGGIKGGIFGGWDGWMFLVNGTDPGKGMTDVEIKNNDDIVVFYGDYGILPLTIDTVKNAAANKDIKVTVLAGGKPIKDASVIVNNEKKGITDDNGNVIMKFEKSGEYNIYAEKNDEKGKPVNIRSDVSTIIVK